MSEDVSADFSSIVKKHADGFRFLTSDHGVMLSQPFMARFVLHCRRLIGAQGPVLMSADNHDGWKLEDLCDQLMIEVLDKNKRIVDRIGSGKLSPVANVVLQNNGQIVSLLDQIKTLQQKTLRSLDTIGQDQGPGGKARV